MSTQTTGQIASVSVDVGGHEIVFETGKLAKQADGAVVVRSGETMILATAVGRPDARPDADFFPLTVDVEEKMYAAGKIPGGFFKREGRATERATLTARMIDRPIRPLWPKGFRNEVQVICTVLSADLVTPHDILCINGASAALMISPLPFMGPIGAVRVGRVEDEFVLNPTLEQLEDSTLDLIVVGNERRAHDGRGRRRPDPRGHDPRGAGARPRRDPDDLRGAGEPARAGRQAEVGRRRPHRRARRRARRRRSRRDRRARLKEAGTVVDALVEELSPAVSMGSTEDDMTKRAQIRASFAAILEKARLAAIEGPLREQFLGDLRELTDAEQDSKELRSAKRDLLLNRILEELELPFPVGAAPAEGEPAVKDSLTKQYVKRAFEAVYKDLVRKKIAVDKRRPDGRSEEEIRTCPPRCRSARGRTDRRSSRAGRRRS